MLSDYWLLSDLDGTLISTPHKAQGQYLPLTRSPCYGAVKRWLLNGGNVCIVTTADQRVIDQVYLPLRECLAESEARCREYVERMARTQPSSQQKDARRRQPMAGKLLLSLYTGAVLYLCTSQSVYLLPGYANALHCATSEAVTLTRAFHVSLPMAPLYVPVTADASVADYQKETMVACVKGTCMNRQTCDKLQLRVTQLYRQFLSDILLGEPVVLDSLKRMSTRYKRMWRSVLTFLENLFLFHKGQDWAVKLPPVGNDFSILFSGAAQSAESKMWKVDFFTRCGGLLAALGILRVEYVEAEVFFNDGGANSHAGVDRTAGGSRAGHNTNAAEGRRHASRQTTEAAQRRQKAQEEDRKVVVAHAVKVLLADAPSKHAAAVHAVVENFANYMTNLLGTDPRDLKKRQSDAPAAYDDVAQVILLGLPFSLFSRYFAKSIPDFIRSGVQAVPQPNSVVFSKTGVSKSTTLRYLLGKERVVDPLSAQVATALLQGGDHSQENRSATGHETGKILPQVVGETSSRPHLLDTAFAACVEANRAASLGDNPHTTDYELTVFTDVPFISVEKQSQRNERHHRIQRRLQRTKAMEDKGEKPTLPDGTPAPSYAELVASQRKSGPMMDDRLLQNVLYVGGEEEGTAVLLKKLMDRLRVPPLSASTGYVSHEDRPVDTAQMQRTLVAAHALARREVQAAPYSKL